MPALGDKVYYYTPETEEKPSVQVPATITGFEDGKAVLFLQGNRYLGYVAAAQSEEPTPDHWVAIEV